MKTRPLAKALILTLLSACCFSELKASTIFWGTKPADLLYDSQGNALDASFTFEIGTFTVGFNPTLANMDQWAANWIVFDAAKVGDGWDVVGQEVSTSAEHLIDSSSSSPDALPGSLFPQGSQAYLWVYDAKALDNTSEWALLCDTDVLSNTFQEWVMPDPSDVGGSSDWQTRDLDTAVFGGVNGSQGPGQFSVNPGTFTIQTHVVPEPGTALLCALAASFLLRRARRVTVGMLR